MGTDVSSCTRTAIFGGKVRFDVDGDGVHDNQPSEDSAGVTISNRSFAGISSHAIA
jgi:hypothetical protein